MKKSIAIVMLLVFTLMLASCARIKTNVTVYNPTAVNLKGATYSYMMLDNQTGDTNYQSISQLVDGQLQGYGMTKVSSNPEFNVVIIYQLAANSASKSDSLEVAIFNASSMYDLHSKPVYLVNVISDGKPKNQATVLQHLVSDAFKTFPATDGKTFSYPENY
ncbi:MAG: DUF4136 domain-containing protein [Gammaproteobacteria bacterium]|nr:DUF4136 domain-containing protein [Gammaproteobacteria bacterium]